LFLLACYAALLRHVQYERGWLKRRGRQALAAAAMGAADDDTWATVLDISAAVVNALPRDAHTVAQDELLRRAALVAGASACALPALRARRAHPARCAACRAPDCLASEGVVAMPTQAHVGLNLKARSAHAEASARVCRRRSRR
jgi:hypothetical protein